MPKRLGNLGMTVLGKDPNTGLQSVRSLNDRIAVLRAPGLAYPSVARIFCRQFAFCCNESECLTPWKL